MSFFDERDMAAITSPDFPGERLIVCRNRDLAREREDLIKATERDLAKLGVAVLATVLDNMEIGATAGGFLSE